MMLPSVLFELFEELEFELPRSAMELSTKDEIIDCADSALAGAEELAPGELEELPVRALIRL